jgi:dUTP pyrophosphatase
MILAPVARLGWQESADLDQTARGAGGFGSTGILAGTTAANPNNKQRA